MKYLMDIHVWCAVHDHILFAYCSVLSSLQYYFDVFIIQVLGDIEIAQSMQKDKDKDTEVCV